MMTNIRSMVTLILVLLVLAIIGVSLWVLWQAFFVEVSDTPAPTAPTPVSTATNALAEVSASPTFTPELPQFKEPIEVTALEATVTPTLIAGPSTPVTANGATPDANAAAAETPAVTETSAVTETATAAGTPTPGSTAIYGQVQAASLNLRQGPGTAYAPIGAVGEESQLVILGRNADGSWLHVRTADGQEGWVAAQFVGLAVDIDRLPLATLSLPSGPVSLNLRSSSVAGRLAPGQEIEYTFFEDQVETVFILMFRPNVNLNNRHVQFRLYSHESGGQLKEIGASSYPGVDRDGNLTTGEMIWRGGPLTPGVRNFLHLTNSGDQVIDYCLTTRDIYEWSCP